MAVLPLIPGINISIIVDGTLATEYIPQPSYFPALIDATGRQGREHNQCFIESFAGSPFAIRLKISSDFKFPRGKTILIIDIYVDGKPFDNRLFQKSYIFKATRRNREYVKMIPYCHRELSDGSSESYNPMFQDIRHPGQSTTTFKHHKITNIEAVFQADDGSGISDPKDIKALGSIQVAVSVARNRGSGVLADDEFSDDKREPLVIDNEAFHRYGSGQMHGTTYIRTAETLDMNYIVVEGEKHIGNFFFYYQSTHAENARINLDKKFKDDNAEEMVHLRSNLGRAPK